MKKEERKEHEIRPRAQLLGWSWVGVNERCFRFTGVKRFVQSARQWPIPDQSVSSTGCPPLTIVGYTLSNPLWSLEL